VSPAALPWRSEHPLTDALVLSLVGAQFPALAPSHAVQVGDGWDVEAWVVDDAWVFKFPKHAAVEGYQDIERAALARLATRVPLPIPVPVHVGFPAPEFPFRFHGCPFLPGVAADHAAPEDLDESACAEALGAFLAALHGIPIPEATAWGIPAGPPLVPRSARALECERWNVVRTAAPEPLRARVDAWLAAADPPLEPGVACVTHGDLRDGNLNLDEGGRRLVALIDWIDLTVADPARDFGGLLGWRGEPFLRAVLARAGRPVDDGLLLRSRRRAAHLATAVAWQGLLAERPPLLASGLRGLDYSVPHFSGLK
jgi:aminoglycoside phosphotransferase (APT) family kinase protein